MHIEIINGPNLNLLGTREAGIYGNISFEQYMQTLQTHFSDVEISYFQSNVEGELINRIHAVGFKVDGIIINAGAYTHTSIAIADALRAVPATYVEVHISNVFSREEFRHVSYLSKDAAGVITGFGMDGYSLAMAYFSAFREVK